MAYTPLTREQWDKAIAAGISPNKIIEFEKKRKVEEEKLPWYEKPGAALIGVGVGARKGFFETVKGTLSLAERMGQKITGFGPEEPQIAKQIPEEWITRKGTAEKIGAGVEQIAELMLLGKVPITAGKIAGIKTAAGLLTKVPRAATAAKALGFGAKLGTQMAGEAAIFGGEEALKTGEIGQEAKTAALLGAVIPPGAEVFKGVGKGLVRGGKWVSEVAGAPKQLRRVKEMIAGVADKVAKMGERITTEEFVKKTTLRDKAFVLKESNNALNTTLQLEAQAQSRVDKGFLKKLFKNMSKTYGAGLKQAEELLIAQGKSISSKQYMADVVDKTIQEVAERGIMESSPAYKALLQVKNILETGKIPKEVIGLKDSGLIQAIINMSKKGEQNLTFQEIQNFRKILYDALSSGVQKGTAFADVDDKIAMMFLKNHGKFLGELSPELKALNAEFAPMAEARGWAMTNFMPYTQGEIQKGADILIKLARGEVPDATALNYIKQLEEGIGRFKGAGELKGATTKLGESMRLNVKQNRQFAKNLLDITDRKIYALQNNIASAKKAGRIYEMNATELENLIKIRNRILQAASWSAIVFGASYGGVRAGSALMGR